MLGQILGNSNMGVFTSSLIENNNIQTVLETGTMDGSGSTKILYEALISKPNPKLFSLETNSIYFDLAKERYKNIEWVKIYNGSIVNFCDINFQKLDGVRQKWLDEDIKNYNSCQHITFNSQNFDLCFLDSSEFCGFEEFKLIEEKTKYVILDDTKTLKHVNTLTYCLKNHECVVNYPEDRNGWACFKIRGN